MGSSKKQYTDGHNSTQDANISSSLPSYAPQAQTEHSLDHIGNIDLAELNRIGISPQDQHYNTFCMFQAVSGTLVSLFVNKEGNDTRAFEKFQSKINEIMNETMEHAKHDMAVQNTSERLRNN